MMNQRVHRSRLRPGSCSDGTGRSLCGPISHMGLKLTQFHGYGRAALAGIPSPKHQRRRHVLDDLLDATMAVLPWILQQLAELAIR
jgi:hypothetical protein